jgi:hypothetical protein
LRGSGAGVCALLEMAGFVTKGTTAVAGPLNLAPVSALTPLTSLDRAEKGTKKAPMPNLDRKAEPRLLVFLLFPLFVFWVFGYQTVWPFLNLELEGVVVSSADSPSRGAPRYVTEYTIHGADGETQAYIAGPTDASLPRSMAVGTRIKEHRWSLYYERDGRWYSFPFVFYSILLSAALCSEIYALRKILLLWWSR